MRRSLSALVLGLSLVLASMAWAGFSLTRTALDPGRSEVLADQMFENDRLRGALVSVLADRLEALLPQGVALPRQLLEDLADRTLDDPAVQLLVRDGLVEVHQKALRGDDTDTTLHATAIGTAARNVLVAERPELDPVLPDAPAMRVQLPTAGLSVLGEVRDAVASASRIAVFMSGLGAALALLVTRDRASILRRLSGWAFGTAAAWLIVAVVFPRAISALAPTQGVLAGAIATVLFGAMVRPAVLLGAAGCVALAGSLVWGAGSRRRGARLVGRPTLLGS
ncbi:MAG: hypothetical protein ACN4GZ_07040 [Acidimicrobiales bacterium]